MSLMDNDDDILTDLDFEIDEPIDVTDVSKLTDYELSNLDRDTREELLELGELMTLPANRSERGSELHSTWIACKVELSKRRH
jgi:hypothetical protein